MSVGPEVVDYVARLAKLQLDDAEKQQLAGELARIVAFVEQLDDIDVSEVAPTKHVIGLANVERPDTPADSLPVDEALANAPDADEDHFVVPKVLPD